VRFVGTVIDITARKKTDRHLRILNDTGATVARERNLETIVQTVTDAGLELCGAEFGAFFYNVENEQGESYRLYTLSGAPMEAFARFPQPRNTAVFGPTFAGEGIVRSADITKDPRYGHSAPYHGMPRGHLPVRSYLAVPVISRSGEVIGGLFFGHAVAGVFDERAETRIRGLAAEAAVAIDNTRLVNELERELAHRRAAEAGLAESETRLRLATDAADIGTWDYNPQTGALTWDAKCKQLFGLPADAEVSFDGTFVSALQPEDREATLAAIEQALDPAGNGRFS